MENIIVYRVQNEANIGPFRAGCSESSLSVELLKKLDVVNRHPLIGADCGFSLWNFPTALVCGCESLKTLRHWFPDREAVNHLITMGMVIKAYVVPRHKVKQGKSQLQVAFNPNDAVSYKTLPISRLLTKAYA
jgi:hypothetical protein